MKHLYLKHLHLKYLAVPTALLLVLSTATLAEETILETVIITATRSEQPAVVTPATINTITREEITASGASSVKEILRTHAGIQLQDNIGNGSRAVISMRGFGANAVNNTLIMVDGRKLNNPSLQGPALGAINPDDIERIEIVQGSAGVLFGDQAVGGVINIITRSTQEARSHLETTRGTDDLESYQGFTSHRLDNGFGYRFSFEDKHADNYRDNNEVDYSNVFGRVEHNSELGQIFLEHQEVNENLNVPGALSQTQVNSDRTQVAPIHANDLSDINDSMTRIGGTYHLTTEWNLMAEVTDRESDNPHIQWGGYGIQNTQLTSFNPRLAGKIPTERGDMLITLGFDREDSDYYRKDVLLTLRGNQLIQDYYAQVIYPASDKLSLTVGARESTVEQKEKISNKNNDDSKTITEVGASYQLNNSSRVFVRRAENIRYANNDETAPGYAPSPFLKPQTGVSNELGYELIDSSYHLQATAYDMDIDNEIAYNPVTFLNENLDASNRRGVILQATLDLTPAWTLSPSYTYTDAQLTAGAFDGKDVPFVSKHMASLSLAYRSPLHYQAYLDAVYTGKRYSVDDDANSFDKVPGYTVLNANVRWDIQQWNINLRVNNLTGKQYSEYISYPYDYQYPSTEKTFELSAGYTF